MSGMRFASDFFGSIKPLASIFFGGFSASSMPSRAILNAQTSVVWSRRYLIPRRNLDGSLIYTPNPTDGRGPMTKEDYLRNYKIPARPRDFFTVGKVFNVLNVKKALEERGPIKKSSFHSHNFSEVLYGETAYSSIYSCVVVDELVGRNACLCCHSHSRGGRGVGHLSPPIQKEHVMLYSRSSIPLKLPEEMHMTRDPLRVRPKLGVDIGGGFRGGTARLDLLLTYTIQYNERVSDIGDVADTDVLKLLQYREDIYKIGKAGRVARTKGVVTSSWGLTARQGSTSSR